VNGAVMNQDAFHAAFDTRPGDAMFLAPDRRTRIW
jgi:putative endopeptidase